MSAALDPAAAVDRLFAMWLATRARVEAACLLEPDDVVTFEVWSHGGAVVIEHDGDEVGYAINSDGQLMAWEPCCGWSAVAEEAAR